MKQNTPIIRFFSWTGITIILLAACARPAPLSSTQIGIPSPASNLSATPLPSPTETIAPTVAPTQTPTQRITRTATPVLQQLDRFASQSISPDEDRVDKWAAHIVSAYPNESSPGEEYHVQLDLIDLSSSETWTIVDEWRPYGLGATEPVVLRWSNDGLYLFIADSGVPDGCGPAFSENLRRVELSTKEIEPIDVVAWGSLSISPDGKNLASFGEGQVLFTDLESGEVTPVPFDQPQAEYWPGDITWAPEGDAILFTPLVNPCGPESESASAILHTSLTDRQTTTLLQPDPRKLFIQSWPLSDLAQLGDPDSEVYWLDVPSGEISAGPPGQIGGARDTLFAFFEALYSGDYARAAEYYGGSYDVLSNQNPDIDPENSSALWERACNFNGYICLPVLIAVLEAVPNPDEYRFAVTFDRDGEPFVLGPCCGADLAEQPPQSTFQYTVNVDTGGIFRVMDLPVYQP